MSEAALADQSLFAQNRRAFLLRKLHSLTGVAPVGAFMVFHLWTNAKALQGQEPFDKAVSEITHTPYLAVLEWGLILLPLLFHAGYGVKLALDAKYNVSKYKTTRNWAFTLQRVTGLMAFAFIAFHLYEYWGKKLAGKLAPEQFYPALCQNMSATVKGIPVVGLLYVLGIAASVFHFANGLWGFCFSWGVTVSRRSQQMAAAVFGVLGVAIFLLGANTAIYFATGSSVQDKIFGKKGGSDARTCVDILQQTQKPASVGPVIE
ncbi:succinate dehydrogenase [Polyangium sp. 15x6]|uniref:succinate dehydrogenase n=1 Tax=Polyangium sp. 15x6 TaxID=3042687 RepID=UPI00249BEB57|nr:succinate dehydrogenase [Polyangium sp. 15x6]MDI3291787.1 succinate dehydrogenase [Polyangium sp. 15x6]